MLNVSLSTFIQTFYSLHFCVYAFEHKGLVYLTIFHLHINDRYLIFPLLTTNSNLKCAIDINEKTTAQFYGEQVESMIYTGSMDWIERNVQSAMVRKNECDFVVVIGGNHTETAMNGAAYQESFS